MNHSLSQDSNVFDEFLEELQSLNDFRSEYASRYEFEGLGRDDPDVERLIEAMAFYRARTRSTVEGGIREHQLRALEQLFPYLLSPLPAMGILYAHLASNMTDTRVLPARSEITVTAPEDAAPEGAPCLFRTSRELLVFPLHIVERSVRLSRNYPTGAIVEAASGTLPVSPWTLHVDIAPSPNGRETKRYYDDPARGLRELRLYMDPKGDVLTALRLYDALQRHCRGVLVRVIAEGSERYRTGPVRVRFGTKLDEPEGPSDNPIESTRRAIHFPLAQLYLVVPLLGLPSEWNRLVLEFLLDEGWPPGLQALDSSFVLGGVPIENLVTRTAEPLSVDGTSLRYVVASAEDPTRWKAREIHGVYATDPNVPGIRKTLLPRSLLDDGYTAIARGRGLAREVWLETESVMGVVDAPATLYVEADWYSPELSLPSSRSAVVRADGHDLGPLCWKILEPLRTPRDSPLLADVQLLERLLELQGKPPNSARELKLLFKILGVDDSELFSRIPRYIERVVSTLLPDLQSHQGSLRSYDVTLGQVPSVLVPAARLIFSLLPRFLATWTEDADVRVTVFPEATVSTDSWPFEWRTLSHA
jgi:type VI secretion system protein ImpG